MIAILAAALLAAAIGVFAAWYAARHVRRQLVPILSLALAVVSAMIASGLTSSGADLATRESALSIAVALLALFVGTSGYLLWSKPRSALMFSATASVMFVATLPLTGFVLACGLIQSCP